MDFYLKADRFLLEEDNKEGSYLHIQEGRFGEFVDELPNDAKVVDWSGYTIAPGLFDTHIHGVRGHDVMDGTTEAVHEMSKTLLEIGVTRFLPTTLTSSKDDLEKAIIAVKEAVEEGLVGAKSEGIFLEGPSFTEKYKGAQNPSYFIDPTMEDYERWQKLADGQIVKIALAPEREGALAFIETLQDQVLMSIAHTDASYDRCKEANEAGARNYVHLFNGMSGLHHREPGVVGAAFTSEGCYAELIADGHHVHQDVAALSLKIKEGKLMLISDCMRAGLMPDGQYHLGEFEVTMKDGMARLDNGSLAGSTLKLIDGVFNLQKWSGQSLNKIWHLASLTPAKSLGIEDRLGSIAAGKLADFVVLNQNQQIVAVAVEGQVKHEANVGE